MANPIVEAFISDAEIEEFLRDNSYSFCEGRMLPMAVVPITAVRRLIDKMRDQAPVSEPLAACAGCGQPIESGKDCPDCVGAQPEGPRAKCVCEPSRPCGKFTGEVGYVCRICLHPRACHAEPSTTKGQSNE